MKRVFKLFRSVVFLVWLSVSLIFATIAAGIWAIQLATTVATMSATAASTAVKHRKQLTRTVAKAKAKARLRKAIVAVPFVGVGAMAYFEEQDYREWKELNPEGTRQQYACEVASLTAEVIDEVLQDLPEAVRPSPSIIMAKMPECDRESNEQSDDG